MSKRVDFNKEWNLFEIDAAEKLFIFAATQKAKDERQIQVLSDRAIEFLRKFDEDKVVESNYNTSIA